MQRPDLGRAVMAGVVAWAVFGLVLSVFPALGVERLNVAVMLSGLLNVDTEVPGWLMLFAAGIVFALGYAMWFVAWLPGPGWQRGLAYGFVPWLAMALVVAPVLPLLNPAMDAHAVPGFLLVNFGAAAVFAMVVACLIWGGVLGALYGHAPRQRATAATAALLLPFLVLAVLVALEKGYSSIMIVEDLSDVTTYDPARASEGAALPVIYNVYDRLVARDGAGEIVPDLARSWTVSADGLLYTFELRSNVLFPSGVELSADDVAWSYRRLKHLNDRPSQLAGSIENVRAVEHYVVRIRLSRPAPNFLAVLASPQFAVLDGRTVLAHGGAAGPGAAAGDTATAWLNTHSAGTGPWMLVRYRPHGEAVLVANPNYWRGDVYHGRIVFKNEPLAASRLRDVESGRADIALGLTRPETAEAQGSPRIRVLESSIAVVPVRDAVHGVHLAPSGILELRTVSKQ